MTATKKIKNLNIKIINKVFTMCSAKMLSNPKRLAMHSSILVGTLTKQTNKQTNKKQRSRYHLHIDEGGSKSKLHFILYFVYDRGVLLKHFT